LNTCTLAGCGDGYLQTGVEECDDGNNANNDGCNAICVIEFCGDGVINGQEICDPGDPAQDFCNDECAYKEFADLILDPHCVGVGSIGWSVMNPNPFSVPNVQVLVDGQLQFDGTMPANTKVGMGVTPDGPNTHTMIVTWPDGGLARISTNKICEPDFIPPALAIPVTGEAFIIPVTGTDIFSAISNQQQGLLAAGAALVGISLLIGNKKKKK
jgi:cysteine-rich repeat protein